jgi:hypothetical protein
VWTQHLAGATVRQNAVNQVPVDVACRPQFGPIVSITAQAGAKKMSVSTRTTLGADSCDSAVIVLRAPKRGVTVNQFTVIHSQHHDALNAFCGDATETSAVDHILQRQLFLHDEQLRAFQLQLGGAVPSLLALYSDETVANRDAKVWHDATEIGP